MSVTMTIDASKELDLNGDFDAVFDELVQVPKMAKMFPKVDKLIDLGNDTYRWEMQKQGFSKYSMQLIYAVKYSNDKEKGVISWEPVRGVGNGVSSGEVRITRTDKGVHVKLSSTMEMELPVPKLVKPLVTPIVMREFNSVAEAFEANLRKHFRS